MNKVILIVCLCCVPLSINAQQYGYVQYNNEFGAPFDNVSTVLQDSSGYIWIGSHNGLYRFDGIHFDIHSINTKSQFIHQLYAAEDHLLFVNDEGLYRIDDLQSQPSVSPLLEATINEIDSLPFYPNDFVVDEDETVWLSQSNHSIGRFQNDQFDTFHFSESENAQKIVLRSDANGTLWALSPLDGLFYFDKASNSFVNILDSKNGTALLIHNGHLLIGKDDLHIYSIDGNQIQFIRNIDFDDDLITTMYVDNKDQYFIGTRNGRLFTLDTIDSQPQAIYGGNEAHRVEELDFGSIIEILVVTDKESNNDRLWVASETGLWLLKERFFKTVNNLPLVNPIAIAVSDEGKAWVPINYLYEISPDEDEFNAEPFHKNTQVSAVDHDVEGYTWVSTSDPDVAILKYDGDQLINRFDDFKDRDEGVFNLYSDSKSNIWFNQSPTTKPLIGIGKLNPNGEIIFYDETKGFSSRALAIKESSRGEIYAVGIGEKSYLYRFDPVNDLFVNISPPLPFKPILNFEAHDLTIDERGIVWLATTDGLLRYDGENISLIQNDVLGQEEVRGVAHYSNNNIWIATATKGLVFHQEHGSTTLGEIEGMPAIITAYRCLEVDSQGRLWVGTAEGLVYSRISAANLPYSKTPTIRNIFIGQDEVTGSNWQSLDLKQNEELAINYSNLSFPAGNVEYQYLLLSEEDRLVTLEEQVWESNGTNNTLALSGIDPGNYYLELRARQTGGYQWSTPLEIQLNVFLPWYSQSWFLFSSIGLLLIVISYYSRLYVKQRFNRLQDVLKYSNQRLMEKEALLDQKNREFESQREELDNATANIHTLELFVKSIPPNASWNDIVTAMGAAVNQGDDIDAFEIAFMDQNEIVHKGYSDLEKGGFTYRSKPFDMLTSLTCWAMSNNQEVIINDFDKEHAMYIQKKDAYRFSSLLFIPFTLKNDQPVALCAYSIHKNHFDHNDLVMFRVLARFIKLTINKGLKKKK